MPRENRKRGKKHKKLNEEEPQYKECVEEKAEVRGEPSWIVPATNQTEEINLEAPFGYVDADVKAYFRTVDIQIRDWQDNQDEIVQDGDVDPNERMYIRSWPEETFEVQFPQARGCFLLQLFKRCRKKKSNWPQILTAQ